MKSWLILIMMTATVIVRGEEPLQNIVDDAWQGAQGYHFSGRLTEIRSAPGKDSGRLSSLYRNIRMLFTSGEDGVVACHVANYEWSPRIDHRGYWVLASSQPLNLAPGWHEIKTKPGASTQAGLLVPDPRNSIGIISDIDDTILVSEVLSKRALLRNSLTVPPEQREVVSGMATLYTRVLKENPAPESSAVFYVSSSPRQLTDNLRRFLQANGFPRGVLQLKEISPGQGDSLGEHADYKLRRIKTILNAFPQTRFHFFGDDGERDPEIYAEVMTKYPSQVTGIWIRRVHPSVERPIYSGQLDVQTLVNSAK